MLSLFSTLTGAVSLAKLEKYERLLARIYRILRSIIVTPQRNVSFSFDSGFRYTILLTVVSNPSSPEDVLACFKTRIGYSPQSEILTRISAVGYRT